MRQYKCNAAPHATAQKVKHARLRVKRGGVHVELRCICVLDIWVTVENRKKTFNIVEKVKMRRDDARMTIRIAMAVKIKSSIVESHAVDLARKRGEVDARTVGMHAVKVEHKASWAAI